MLMKLINIIRKIIYKNFTYPQKHSVVREENVVLNRTNNQYANGEPMSRDQDMNLKEDSLAHPKKKCTYFFLKEYGT